MLCEVISSIAIEIFGAGISTSEKEDDQQRIPRKQDEHHMCDDGTPWTLIETPDEIIRL
jgi:hypothetical protein